MISPPGPLLTVFIVYSAVAAFLYAFFFMFRNWRRDAPNRALMLKGWGNVLVLGMGAATALFGDYPFREQVRVAGFAVFVAGITYLLYALLTSPGAHNYPPHTWARRVAGLWRERSNR